MNDNNLNNTSRTDWTALEEMTDDEIDYSDLAPLDEDFFEKAVLRIPAEQARNLIQLDPDIMAWFRAQGEDNKTRINTILRRYIESQSPR
ncbi:MAG: BrnA antitoxin family protein [Cyanobacteriota bacterium]|nr:BrnA antitoxin family protein [Cyanobacteriota bacterium]